MFSSKTRHIIHDWLKTTWTSPWLTSWTREPVYITEKKKKQSSRSQKWYVHIPPGYTAQCCHVTTQPSRKPRTAHVGCSSPYWSKRAWKTDGSLGTAILVMCLSVSDGRFQFGIHPPTKIRCVLVNPHVKKWCLLQYWDPCFYKTHKE